MKIRTGILLLLILAFTAGFAQSKKEIKKLKIKSVTVTVTENGDGKEKTFTESFKRFDNSAN